MTDPRPQDFPLRTTDKLRYGDTDRHGQVNNAVFSTFLETGRVEMVFDADHPLLAPGIRTCCAPSTLPQPHLEDLLPLLACTKGPLLSVDLALQCSLAPHLRRHLLGALLTASLCRERGEVGRRGRREG